MKTEKTLEELKEEYKKLPKVSKDEDLDMSWIDNISRENLEELIADKKRVLRVMLDFYKRHSHIKHE